MFTGIIETLAQVKQIQQEGTNLTFTLQCILAPTFKIDQSVAHDGVCLTVTQIHQDTYQVTAIAETLQRTNLASWKVGTRVNIERSMLANQRVDGHWVQGHIDTLAHLQQLDNQQGSWEYTFESPVSYQNLMVEKGSIAINGISLTLAAVTENRFKVAIIPYTYEHTNLQHVSLGDSVNIEFDILGKYVQKQLQYFLKQ